MNSEKPTILIVDDEAANLQKLRRTFVSDCKVLEAESGEQALKILGKNEVSVIVTDQRMPGMTGVELLERSRKLQPDAIRVILTGYTEVDDLMDAINEGQVHRYITKPWQPDALRQTVRQQLKQWELERENRRLSEELRRANELLQRENLQLRREVVSLKEGEGELIYRSRAMAELLALVDRVAPTDSTVLIQGETGTGKELLARHIQRRSGRSEGPFVPVNCGAIPADLVESAFFGHRRGAFTGAVDDARGYFELAHRGTLFLDEIGEAPVELQVKLLRVLQDGQIHAVGAEKPKKIDVRVIASTNRSLTEMVEKGTFRQDLFFRLNVFSVFVPPLRARPEDVPPLAERFLERFRVREGQPVAGFEDRTIKLLQAYPWPGNVRELENEVERLSILSDPATPIPPEAVSERILQTPTSENAGSLKDRLAQLERRLILDALKAHGGNRSHAAQSLGITRQTVISKLKSYRNN